MADRMKEKFENILYYHKTKILAGLAAAALLLYAAAVLGGGSADTVLYVYHCSSSLWMCWPM